MIPLLLRIEKKNLHYGFPAGGEGKGGKRGRGQGAPGPLGAGVERHPGVGC